MACSVQNMLEPCEANDKALLQLKKAIDTHSIVSITDIKGTINYVNQKFIDISGYKEDELLGHNHRIINSGYHEQTFFKAMYKTIKQGNAWQNDICNKAKNGNIYWVNTTVVPFVDDDGKPERYVSIRTDITSEKLNAQKLVQTSQALSQKIMKLEQANAELDQFAYVASHDLKSPLHGISQLVSWLEEDCADILPHESKEHLSLLRSRSKRMIWLLNDLLDYSRIGRQEHQVECFYLAAVVDDIFELQGNREGFSCTAKNVAMIAQKAPFELVIRNLISNALKHHDKSTGQIDITLATNEQFYTVSVQDDGPGIPPYLQEKALEMFQTLQSRDKTEGSGMGLALVKKTVHHHGGSLVINSNGERGTNIVFTWPISVLE